MKYRMSFKKHIYTSVLYNTSIGGKNVSTYTSRPIGGINGSTYTSIFSINRSKHTITGDVIKSTYTCIGSIMI